MCDRLITLLKNKRRGKVMKKGLSVLLIVAALFGFYGGAVNLNDVLACKDYWEEEGDRSTADMNKLEDGLNQLKDNEQAYLDGLDAVADGEDALAQGEADYAAGQATLAQGEADYAAAPGKLAAGEKKLAAGKAKLAAGYADYENGQKALAAGKAEVKKGEKELTEGKKTANESTASLNNVIKLLNQIKVGYADYSTSDDGSRGPSWKKGYQSLKDGRNQAVGMLSQPEYADILEKLKVLTQNENLGENINSGASYADFDASVAELIAAFDEVEPRLSEGKELADTYKDNAGLKGASALLKEKPAEDATEEEIEELDAKKSGARKTVAGLIGQLDSSKLKPVKVLDSEKYDALNGALKTLETNSDAVSNAQYAATIDGLQSGLVTLSDTLGSYSSMLTTTKGLLKSLDEGYKTLAGKQAYMADGLKQIYSGVVGNATVKQAFEDNAPALLQYMQGYNAGVVFGKLGNEDLPDFVSHMDTIVNVYNPGIIKVLQGVKKAIADKVKDGEDKLKAGRAAVTEGEKALRKGARDLAAGEKELAAGKKELAKGYADYKAAPGKLAAGRAALAEGLQKLMDGRKELAAGKDKLAEYEDGEQQVRDGLATLMGTEANGGLESILDRRSGDDDFDNGDKHLDLDEGLDAVDVGRGYQADSGELITKEITNRAIGTAAGLGAGALAVLAAILSFLKKNKGSGVCALLSAAAGGAGIAAGTSAGTEFSSIAGSAVGATPWIAFGILAAVAAVHAIAHFASKEA